MAKKFPNLNFKEKMDIEISQKYAYLMAEIIENAYQKIDKLEIPNGQKTFLFLCSALQMINEIIDNCKEKKLQDDLDLTLNLVKDIIFENANLVSNFKIEEIKGEIILHTTILDEKEEDFENESNCFDDCGEN